MALCLGSVELETRSGARTLFQAYAGPAHFLAARPAKLWALSAMQCLRRKGLGQRCTAFCRALGEARGLLLSHFSVGAPHSPVTSSCLAAMLANRSSSFWGKPFLIPALSLAAQGAGSAERARDYWSTVTRFSMLFLERGEDGATGSRFQSALCTALRL